MNLTTLARVKALTERITTQFDLLLADQIIPAISRQVETYLSRHVERIVRTEQYDVRHFVQQRIFLRGYPVDSNEPFEIRHSERRNFTGDVVAASNFYLDTQRGVVKLDDYLIATGPGVVQIVYTGGMAEDTADFITSFPDAAHAVDMQCAFVLQRKDQAGLTLFTAEGGSIAFKSPIELTDSVKAILDPYVRLVETM